MKKYELELSDYPVTFKKIVEKKLVDATENYEFKNNISNLLRTPGIFKTGLEIVDAIMLAKQIRGCEDDTITLDESEAKMLKECLDTHIVNPDNPLGGPVHEQAICRVFQMREV